MRNIRFDLVYAYSVDFCFYWRFTGSSFHTPGSSFDIHSVLTMLLLGTHWTFSLKIHSNFFQDPFGIHSTVAQHSLCCNPKTCFSSVMFCRLHVASLDHCCLNMFRSSCCLWSWNLDVHLSLAPSSSSSAFNNLQKFLVIPLFRSLPFELLINQGISLFHTLNGTRRLTQRFPSSLGPLIN